MIYALIESQDSNSERKCSLFCNLMCWLPASSPTPFPRQASQCCSAAENSKKHHSACNAGRQWAVFMQPLVRALNSEYSAAESSEQSYLAMQRRRQAASNRGFCSSTGLYYCSSSTGQLTGLCCSLQSASRGQLTGWCKSVDKTGILATDYSPVIIVL